jgi:hypothetical protein
MVEKNEEPTRYREVVLTSCHSDALAKLHQYSITVS